MCLTYIHNCIDLQSYPGHPCSEEYSQTSILLKKSFRSLVRCSRAPVWFQSTKIIEQPPWATIASQPILPFLQSSMNGIPSYYYPQQKYINFTVENLRQTFPRGNQIPRMKLAKNHVYRHFLPGKQTDSTIVVGSTNRKSVTAANNIRQSPYERKVQETSKIVALGNSNQQRQFPGDFNRESQDKSLTTIPDSIYCNLSELSLNNSIEIPIVRYTKAAKANHWDVTVQTQFDYMPAANLKGNHNHQMMTSSTMTSSLISEKRGNYKNKPEIVNQTNYSASEHQSSNSPRIFCASVDKVSKMMSIPKQGNPNKVEKASKIEMLMKEGEKKCKLDQHSNSPATVSSAKFYVRKNSLEETVHYKTSNKLPSTKISTLHFDVNRQVDQNVTDTRQRSESDLVICNKIETTKMHHADIVKSCGKGIIKSTSECLDKHTRKSNARSRSVEEMGTSKCSFATHSELSRSSSDILNATTISDVSIFDETDPDWCFDLHGGNTDDNTSTSEASPNSEQTVRGNMLLRFVNNSKRRIISDGADETETLSEEKRNRLNFKANMDANSTKNLSPYFIRKPKHATVKPGEPARFMCSWIGYPKPEVSWYLHDVQLKNDNRTRIKEINSKCYLELEDIAVEESGTVKCVISNPLGKSEVYVQLIVQDQFLDVAKKSVRILTPISNVETTEGSNVRYKCKIYGNEFDVRWYHNGKVIVPDKQFKFTDFKYGNAILELRKVRQDDSGVITCYVCNGTDHDKSSSILKVAGKLLQ
ncbi:hypothetical protein GJ496_006014 [Pomphorhynchus laevis]|nr:hypothetical protein GJ496_006014 [Pomphorhynchus laevis]